MLQVRIKFEEGDLNGCRAVLTNQCVEEDPETMVAQATLYAKEGRYDNALELYSEAFNIQGYDAGFHEIDYPDAVHQESLRVPALGALFSMLPDEKYLIELKPQDVSAADSLCSVIRQHNMQNQVMVGSFHTQVLKHFRRECPEIPTSLGQTEITQLVLLEKLGLSHLFTIEGYAIHIPISYGVIDILSLSLVNQMHARNVRVDTWTLNDADFMRQSIIATRICPW